MFRPPSQRWPTPLTASSPQKPPSPRPPQAGKSLISALPLIPAICPTINQMDLAAKSARLQTTLHDLGSVLVAYSGGTDSAYLAYAAHQALGVKMLAVI